MSFVENCSILTVRFANHFVWLVHQQQHFVYHLNASPMPERKIPSTITYIHDTYSYSLNRQTHKSACVCDTNAPGEIGFGFDFTIEMVLNARIEFWFGMTSLRRRLCVTVELNGTVEWYDCIWCTPYSTERQWWLRAECASESQQKEKKRKENTASCAWFQSICFVHVFRIDYWLWPCNS